MDFALPAELRDRAERARRFAEGRATAKAGGALDLDTWRAAASFGLFGSASDLAAGGKSALAAFVLFEAMGRGGLDRSLLFAMGAHLFGCAIPIAAHGTEAQRGKWLAGLVDGSIVGALAITEPQGGSSLDLIQTGAGEAPGGVVLNGEKTLVCNAPDAGVFVLLARQNAIKGPLGLSAFLVPRGAEGLSVARIDSTLGLKAAPMGRLTLKDCFVPADAMLGRAGSGLRVFATAMQWERTCLLACFLGAAERDLAACVGALRARRDADGPLMRHQGVSHALARLKLTLEAARLVGQRGAWAIDRGTADTTTAAMAKLALSEAVAECAEKTLKLMAGSAWQGRPLDFGAALADALGGLFASGTSEIQLDIIARSLSSEPRPK